MPYRRRVTIALATLFLALALGAAPAAAKHGFETGNGGYFEPPTISDTQIVGPMYVSQDHGVNIHGPLISFERGKGNGAPLVSLPAVQTPAGVAIPSD